jgi:hypothetical protein
MPDEKKADEKPVAKKAPQDMVTLQHEVTSNWTLRIDASEYVVTGGQVKVPVWHVDAARQAGFK